MQTAHTACRCCWGLGQECKYNRKANQTCKHKIPKETHFTHDKGCQCCQPGRPPHLTPYKWRRMAHLCRQPTGKHKSKLTEINQSSFTSTCFELNPKTTHPSAFRVVWVYSSQLPAGWDEKSLRGTADLTELHYGLCLFQALLISISLS